MSAETSRSFSPVTLIAGLAIIVLATLIQPALAGEFPEDQYTLDSIRFSGNTITREHVLIRELTFSVGISCSYDSLQSLMVTSRQNLLNTGLFNFVESRLIPRKGDPDRLTAEFVLTERWYFWPLPLLEIADRNINSWWESGAFNRLNYGLFLQHDNFRGRMEELALLFLTGKDQIMGMLYSIPYLDAKQRWGMEFSFLHSRSSELLYGAAEDIPQWLEADEEELMKRTSFSAALTYRKAYFDYHILKLTYSRFQPGDTILQLNPSFAGELSRGRGSYLGLSYTFKSDHRDQCYYPLRGHYLDFKVSVGSAPGGDGPGPNSSFLVNFRKYEQISSRWFLAGGMAAFYALPPNSPFIFEHGLGFDRKFVRGYEDYLFLSTQYLLLKSGLMYAILSPREFRLPVINMDQFKKVHLAMYLGPFADLAFAGSATGHAKAAGAGYLMGYGLGLNIVTYYDKVLRLEFSRNRKGETGLYVHVIAPI